MAIKEYREFFLRASAVNAGTKKDQETGFPTSYLIDGTVVGNRYLKLHYPSEDVNKKLFESIAFHLNTESTATAALQGLVIKSDQTQYDAGTDNDSDGYAIYVPPSFLRAEIGDRQYTNDNYVTDSETITESIDALDTQLGTISTQVGTNTTNIGTNTGNIATNTSNIGQNTTDIGTNTGNIATNVASIAANTADIDEIRDGIYFSDEENNGGAFGTGGSVQLLNISSLGGVDRDNVILIVTGQILNASTLETVPLSFSGTATYASSQLFDLDIAANDNESFCVQARIASYTHGETIIFSFLASSDITVNRVYMTIIAFPNI